MTSNLSPNQSQQSSSTYFTLSREFILRDMYRQWRKKYKTKGLLSSSLTRPKCLRISRMGLSIPKKMLCSGSRMVVFLMDLSRKIPKRVSSWPVDREKLSCLTSHTTMASGSKTFPTAKDCTNSPTAAITKENSSKVANRAKANSQQHKATSSIKGLSWTTTSKDSAWCTSSSQTLGKSVSTKVISRTASSKATSAKYSMLKRKQNTLVGLRKARRMAKESIIMEMEGLGKGSGKITGKMAMVS